MTPMWLKKRNTIKKKSHRPRKPYETYVKQSDLKHKPNPMTPMWLKKRNTIEMKSHRPSKTL